MTSNKKILQAENQLLFPNQYLVEVATEKSVEKKTIQILIVEDSLNDTEILLFHLKKEGFIFKWNRVDTEEDYLNAISNPPDIILSDWKFPKFSGMRALELLKESKLDVPFIIISGSIGEEAAVDALHKGAYDYLMKDRPNKLGEVIRNALKQKLDNEKNRRIKEISFIQTSALNAAANPIVITDINGTIQWVNPSFSTLTGYSGAEAIGKNPRDLLKSGLVKAEIYKIMWDTILAGEIWRGELINRKKDGQTYYEEQTITPVRNSDGVISQFIAIKQDITDRKRSEEALREREERFKALIENSSDAITLLDAEGKTIYDSPAAPGMLGYGPDDWIGRNVFELLHPDDSTRTLGLYQDLIVTPGKRVNTVFRVHHKNGSWVWLEVVATNLLSEQSVKAIVLNYSDITERKKAEENREETERVKSDLLNKMNEAQVLAKIGSWDWDLQTNHVWWSDETYQIFGLTPQEFVPSFEENGKFIHPDDFEKYSKAFEKSLLTGESLDVDLRLVANDGLLKLCQAKGKIIYDVTGKAAHFIGTIMDITDRKKAEEVLTQTNNRLSLAQHSSRTGLWDWNIVTGKLEWSPELLELFGLDLTTIPTFDVWRSIMHPDDVQAAGDRIDQVIRDHKPLSNEYRIILPTGEVLWIMSLGNTTYIEQGEPERMTGICIDITQRKQGEQRIQGQFEQLTTLRDIDKCILSSFDLEFNLRFILSKAMSQLRADAADILLLNPLTQTLNFAAGCGFHTKAIEYTNLHIGESHAGRAALELSVVHIPNLQKVDTPLFTISLDEEKFISFYAIPLLVKGKVKGVLEVFHRSTLELDADALNFLNSLAGQAAIAIENSTLYDNQQRSYQELTLAYDATIEGWSHAMDLRDKETEGHTLRVTDLTLKLGFAYGLSDDELMQARWGALLHDIGKLGVPDAILHKTESLTDEEWVVMKRHPTFAYEMLSPIHYLQQALDIPYYHHEKWDGSGYPKGLKGKQIPLTARIFAVVDVWDALRSDRPYRTAWLDEKVFEHIRSLSGKHFDPHVVEVFLKLPK